MLRGCLLGHTGDVRAACFTADGRIVTGSRDLSARLWQCVEGDVFLCLQTFKGHHRYIMGVAAAPASAQHPNGLIATASLDNSVLIFDPAIAEPLLQLQGHTNAVCSVAFDADGSLLTSSWDGSAKLWREGQCVATLSGHEKSVLCAVFAPHGLLATGSADHTIRVWDRGGRCTATLRGHTDAVRSLVMLESGLLLSAANDGTLRLWELTGSCIRTVQAHSAYIYSVCVLPNGDWVSSGEDGHVRVWRDGECVQHLAQPCLSVWCVAASADGDLVVGGNDGTARVFTRHVERAAAAAVRAAYEAELQAAVQAREKGMVGDLNTEQLPSRSALSRPGKREGDALLVRHGGVVEAYQWEQGRWVLTGQVTDAVDKDKDTSTTFYIELDGKKMPLVHKSGENPYVSAQRFLHANELDQMFLEEIAQFITVNTTAPTLTTAMPANPDPFTGRGAYRPSASAAPSSAAPPAVLDPFTGRNAYTTAAASRAPAVAAGSGGAASAAVGGGLVVNRAGIPFDTPLNVAAVAKKLGESGVALGADEQSLLQSLPAAPGREDAVCELCMKLLSLPPNACLPGLDVTRVAVLGAEVRQRLLARGVVDKAAAISPAHGDSNYIMAVRVLCNLAAHGALVSHPAPALQQAAAFTAWPTSRPGGLAVSALLLNLATAFVAASDLQAAEHELECLRLVAEALEADAAEAEVTYRLLVALSTLVGGSEVLRAAALTIPSLHARVRALVSHLDSKVSRFAQGLAPAFS